MTWKELSKFINEMPEDQQEEVVLVGTFCCFQEEICLEEVLDFVCDKKTKCTYLEIHNQG